MSPMKRATTTPSRGPSVFLALLLASGSVTSASSQQVALLPTSWGSMTDLIFRSAPIAGGQVRRALESQEQTIQISTRYMDQSLAMPSPSIQASELNVLWNQNMDLRLGLQMQHKQFAPGLSAFQVRLMALKWIRIDAESWWYAGLELGLVRLQMNPESGVWEDQYLQNPLDPNSVISAESSWTDFQRTLPDLAGRIGWAHSPNHKFAYAFQYLPFDRGILFQSVSRKNFHHALSYRLEGNWNPGVLFADWHLQFHGERQAGAQAFGICAWAEVSAQSSSVYTTLERPPRLLMGAELSTHGLIRPMLGLAIREQHRIWISHTADLRRQGFYADWTAGLHIAFH